MQSFSAKYRQKPRVSGPGKLKNSGEQQPELEAGITFSVAAEAQVTDQALASHGEGWLGNPWFFQEHDLYR